MKAFLSSISIATLSLLSVAPVLANSSVDIETTSETSVETRVRMRSGSGEYTKEQREHMEMRTKKIDNMREHMEERREKNEKMKDRLVELNELTEEELTDFVDEHGGLEAFQSRLTKSLEKAIKHLTSVKARIEANATIDDTAKAEVIADIDADIAELEAMVADVANTTITEIVEMINMAHTKYEEYKKASKKAVSHHLESRVEHMIEKGEMVLERFNTKVDELAAAGADVTVLTQAAATFEIHLEAAKIQADLAISLFAQARESDDPDTLIEQAVEAAKAAQEELKTGREALHAAIRAYMAILNENDDSDVETDTETETETETE